MTTNLKRSRRSLLRRWQLWLFVLLAVLLLAVPSVAQEYYVGVLTKALILGLFAISVDITIGYTGLITLAPAAFFGIGAYSVAKVVVDYSGSYWLGFPLAVVLAAVIAVLIGYAPIKRRIGEVYFVLFTMAFGIIVYDFVFVASWLTGGSNGLGYLSPPTVFAIDLSQTVPYYYFALFVVGGVGLLLYLLVRSDYGEILHAIRQNELRMRYLGYDTDREKLIAWVLSAVTSSLAGAVYVGTIGLAAPQMMSFALTGEVLIWVVVGGSGTLVGPFVAAVALTLLEESLGNLWAEGYLIVLGLLFVGFIFFLPNGLAGLVQRMRE